MNTKKILGLDLGTTRIGWALVNESIDPQQRSEIIKIGVRVNPLTVDEKDNFSKGADITTNADRTLKRSMRRNLQRYKLRRDELTALLKSKGWISDDTILTEHTNRSTFETWQLRAKAAKEHISLEEFARVLLMINKKRGYKSSRKAKSNDEGELIDGMTVAKQLYEQGLTPGQFSYQLLMQGHKHLPDYYRSDLRDELQKIWTVQAAFYSNILTQELYETLIGRNERQTWAILAKAWDLAGIKINEKGEALKKELYRLRSNATQEKLNLEYLAVVLQKINGQINASSGYLGAISDRSKELYFNNQTVGEFQWTELQNNPHHSLKNEVFYRADYMDEFERIWEQQALYHSELTPELKRELRDVIIFYQRPLRSQKGLIGYCEFEKKQKEIMIDGKKKIVTSGCRVSPKSSPLFQEFKIWQILNNIVLSWEDENHHKQKRELTNDEKNRLHEKLNTLDKLSKADALKLLYGKPATALDLNYKEIEGNRTIAAFYRAYLSIVNLNMPEGKEIKKPEYEIIRAHFEKHGINTDILSFNSNVSADALQNEPLYKLWHLLYSYEGDKSNTGIESLIHIISERYGFTEDQAKIIANIKLVEDYGNLSTKAMRNILPYMREGKKYDEACEYAGYKFSKQSLTREEIDSKELKALLDILPKNSLRNPVVEKILNQMINVVNNIIEEYGRPDEIRIELARELKKNAEKRKETTKSINDEKNLQEKYRQILHDEFGLEHVSRNDIIRYKLYLELEKRGYKTLYSNTYIPRERLFSKDFDIEHIIPQAKVFDDSFANKTLELRQINIEKSNMTAIDFMASKYGEQGVAEYIARIDNLAAEHAISPAKAKYLKMREDEIQSGFLNRDLSDTAYIARKAREILLDVVPEVHTTSGSITNRLREDWQLVNLMQELNWDKYNAIGQVEYYTDHDGRRIGNIKDWTKRNDHRHHAMDALTIAFTRPEYVNYLNNLNARSDKSGIIFAVEKKYLHRNEHGKIVFLPPMPLDQFRAEAKKQLEAILVSIKAKNKVVTRNVNKSKTKSGYKRTEQLTPRGQLHNETVYGSRKKYVTKMEKVGSAFDVAKIMTVAKPAEREMLLQRLQKNGMNPKKAFTGKNALDMRVKTVSLETEYTIRKAVAPDLNVDKVIDQHVRQILEARLAEYGNDPRKAFANLDENPIYLNKEKGITIKRVAITGVSNAVALHDKKDNQGQYILDAEGNRIPTDFVNTGSNHHVAIYQDAKGEWQEHVVSFYEATMRSNQELPVVDKEYNKDLGWTFLFTMKQNEYFVFPNDSTNFNPQDLDLTDPANYSAISPYLYRVQKLTQGDYWFRHHLETQTDSTKKELRDITWKRITSPKGLKGIVKVRINHLGEIVAVGEY